MSSGFKKFYRWLEERQIYGNFCDPKDSPFFLKDIKEKNPGFLNFVLALHGAFSSMIDSDFFFFLGCKA